MINWHDIHRTTRDGLLKLVWKRLCIKDNWAEINHTKDLSDAQLGDFILRTNLAWSFQGIMNLKGKSLPISFV
jgi:nuclear pore complex protein Nup133